MLWTLLIATSSFTFVYGALATARDAHAGVVGLAAVLASGMALAIGNYWCWEKASVAVVSRVRVYSDSVQNRGYGILYFSAGVWIFAAAGLAQAITLRILSLLS
jgi:hypothetical protein